MKLIVAIIIKKIKWIFILNKILLKFYVMKKYLNLDLINKKINHNQENQQKILLNINSLNKEVLRINMILLNQIKVLHNF